MPLIQKKKLGSLSVGKRGPGAGRLRAAAALHTLGEAHPWDQEGMTPADRVLAFLRELPIVSASVPASKWSC